MRSRLSLTAAECRVDCRSRMLAQFAWSPGQTELTRKGVLPL